jgi:hypothetical protein
MADLGEGRARLRERVVVELRLSRLRQLRDVEQGDGVVVGTGGGVSGLATFATSFRLVGPFRAPGFGERLQGEVEAMW